MLKFKNLRFYLITGLLIIVGIKGYNIRFTELDSDNYRPMAEFSRDNIYAHVLDEGTGMASLSEKRKK